MLDKNTVPQVTDKSNSRSITSPQKQGTKHLLNKSKFLLKITSKILSKSNNISDDPKRAIEFEDNIDAWIDKATTPMWEQDSKEFNEENEEILSNDREELDKDGKKN